VNAVWSFISDMTGWLKDISGGWWFLVIVFVIATLDSIFPVVPSETTVIIGGVAASAAGDGPYPVVLVILCGALGAFTGDNLSYLIGRRAHPWVEKRAARREKSAQRLDWAAHQIEERGGLLLITARFIPGGRTLLTLSCGMTRQHHRWFAGWVSIAALIWATYASILGYAFGTQFEDDHTLAFLLAFGAALSITVVIEMGRYAIKKRAGRLEPKPEFCSTED
jgi:membrane protein DedA with SNARE-associated domain